jgi:hypothetical protein
MTRPSWRAQCVISAKTTITEWADDGSGCPAGNALGARRLMSRRSRRAASTSRPHSPWPEISRAPCHSGDEIEVNFIASAAPPGLDHSAIRLLALLQGLVHVDAVDPPLELGNDTRLEWCERVPGQSKSGGRFALRVAQGERRLEESAHEAEGVLAPRQRASSRCSCCVCRRSARADPQLEFAEPVAPRGQHFAAPLERHDDAAIVAADLS